MLVLTQDVVKKGNEDVSEVVIDLREFGLGMVVVAPVKVQGSRKVRIGYAADERVKILRRAVLRNMEGAA